MPTQVVDFFKGQGIDPLPFDNEGRKKAQARMANPDLIDGRTQAYFMELREDFVRSLGNQHIKENQARHFLADKGAY